MTQSLIELRRELLLQASSTLILRGPSFPRGQVDVQGSKNGLLRLIPAMVATPGCFVIDRIPRLLDVVELLLLLQRLGASVELDSSRRRCYIDTRRLRNTPLPRAETQKTTASFYLLGALVGRFGRADIGLPGGDRIGPRPVNIHIDALRELGIRVQEVGDRVVATWPPGHSTHITIALRAPSAGAAINTLLAVHARRLNATIENTPDDPDFAPVYELIEATGSALKIAPGSVHIDARRAVSPQDTIQLELDPDPNDTITWMVAGAVSPDWVELRYPSTQSVEAIAETIRGCGAEVDQSAAGVRVRRNPIVAASEGVARIVAGPSPGIHSDWLPLLQVLLCTRRGKFETVDTLYADRSRLAILLERLGGDIRVLGGPAPPGVHLHFDYGRSPSRYRTTINGPCKLRGATLAVGNDVRATAAIALAGLIATGETRLTKVVGIPRGYDDFVPRLQALHSDARWQLNQPAAEQRPEKSL